MIVQFSLIAKFDWADVTVKRFKGNIAIIGIYTFAIFNKGGEIVNEESCRGL